VPPLPLLVRVVTRTDAAASLIASPIPVMSRDWLGAFISLALAALAAIGAWKGPAPVARLDA
jgi:hypothetical protein